MEGEAAVARVDPRAERVGGGPHERHAEPEEPEIPDTPEQSETTQTTEPVQAVDVPFEINADVPEDSQTVDDNQLSLF